MRDATSLARAGLGFAVGVALAAAAGGLPRPPEARAQDASSGVTGPSCVIKGNWPVAKGTRLLDAASGGRAIATFTGGFVPMQMSDLPADPPSGRARLATSNGSPSLRLEGWVAPSAIPMFTARDVPVVGGHVWISSAQKVRLVRAAPNAVTAELTIAGSSGQTVRATTSCDAISLQRGTPTGMEVPGNGRGYLMKSSELELYEDAGGDAIFTLHMMEGSAQLFWSTESRNGFVHVQSRGDLTIDAWARWRDLEALKKGEMMDQAIPPSSAVTGAQLSLDKPPPLLRATKDIPVRSKRDAKEKPIGVIETGADVFVMETMAGWTNVLPKSLGMTPPDDGGFWIPSSEAPK